MKRKIGMVAEDPVVAQLVNQYVISHTPVRWMDDHLNTAVYVRRLLNNTPEFDVLEGTAAMAAVGIENVLFLQRDIGLDIVDHGTMPNRATVVYSPEIAPITAALLANGIREHLRDGTIPDNEALWPAFDEVHRLVRAWGDLAIDLGLGQQPRNIIELPPASQEFAIEIVSPKNYANEVFMAMQGGLSPHSSSHALKYATDKYDAAVMLVNMSSLQQSVLTGVMTLVREGHLSPDMETAPVHDLKEMRMQLETLHPDVALLMCNTAHYYFPQITQDARIPSAHMIEETVSAIPDGASVLMLGTRQTLEAGLYEQAAEKLSKDINWIKPSELEQRQVQYAIEEMTVGKFPSAAKKIATVLKAHKQELDNGALVGAFCTEIVFALDGKIPNEKVLESSEITIDRGMEIAKYMARERQKIAADETPKTGIQFIDKEALGTKTRVRG